MRTILDVEKHSGVSRSTISRYLNGKPVTDDNRVKIEHSIKVLNYHRNPLASGLKSNKTMLVGIVIPDITDPFFPPIVKDLEQQLWEQGYQTLINNYNNDIELEKKQVRVLINQRIDGLIIASGAIDGAHIQEVLDKGIPVVMIDRLLSDVKCDSVTTDNYYATYHAIQEVIQMGHTKIAIIRGQEHVYSDQVRYWGYENALRANGIPVRSEYVIHSALSEHDSAEKFQELMNLPDPPTLIFSSNIYLAAGAVGAKLEYNLNIPEDVSVLTFDKVSAFPYYSFLRCLKPEFASICQPIADIATEASELLLHRMQTGMEDYNPIHRELKNTLTLTESIKDLR
ncbi:LacI family DNA-binding transcriptional regulator [Chakrabartyella piscis]|uniref:LacI family DNA-binding transcriptional regulator n=1 Tax=Chakrabartyella piscis TaxID=2918914 RepID=UPI0029587DFB|nr:LacI family DNA-binding transcriptional regulator [Chakrabartyella piscis]